MNADGTGQTKLTQNPGGNGNPSWSPDARLIAFESDQGGQFEVYIMNADGTGQRQLTSLAGGNGSPVWGREPARPARAAASGRCRARPRFGGIRPHAIHSIPRPPLPC